MHIPIQRKEYTTGLSSISGFGNAVSDHMFLATWSGGRWSDAHILPYGNLSISPVMLALHYGQSVFEGMKAFRTADGSINIFRIERHHQRLNKSLQRMCMPSLPFELFEAALRELITVDAGWVPEEDGASLYIRPLVFASEGKLGVKVAEEYTFLLVTGPVAQLYAQPIKVKVERSFIRAARGGTGAAKCAGNYGGAFYPTSLAREEGFDQVIWTDALQHEFIEESGTMNLMFVIDGKLVTPPVSDSILDGITRDSLIQLARHLGIAVEERPVSITELKAAFAEGRITEAFGAGTAAVVAPIASIGIDEQLYALPATSDNAIQTALKKELEAIRTGRSEDLFNWNYLVEAAVPA